MRADRDSKGRNHWFTVLVFVNILSLALLTAVATAGATTYYVSPSGSDSNIGSPTAPFKTIQKAANTVNPGDTVLVRAGTYAGFKVFRSGTSGNYIVFKVYPGETVTIDSYTNKYAYTTRGIELGDAVNYVTFDGFTITDSNPLYDSSAFADYSTGISHEGIKFNYNTTAPSYITISNMTMYHIGFHGIYGGGSASSNPSHITISGNTLYDIGLSKRGYGIYLGGINNTISGNVIHDAYGHGIQAQDGDGSTFTGMTIEDNLLYNNGRNDYNKGYSTGLYGCAGNCPNGVPVGDGIIIWNGASSTIENNIIYDNLQWGLRIRGNTNLAVNNTIYQNGYQGIYAYDNYTSTIRNNISNKNGGGGYSGDYYIGTGNSQDHNLFGVNPLFVDPNNGDFHLQSGSPAIDKGTSTQAPMYDFTGNSRTGNPDIGAYEYTTTAPTATPVDTTPPLAPTGLTATAVSSSQINLSWTASSDNIGVAGYKVYRNGNLVATVSKTSYPDVGLLAGTTYTYRVSAYDAAGNVSGQSAAVSATTQTQSAPSGSNALTNSGFETGTSPWVFYTDAAGTFKNDASGDGSLHAGHVTIPQPGTNVQLFQSGIVLQPNTRYTLSFKAFSNTGHALSVLLIKHTSPYTSYGLSNTQINLTGSWNVYTIQFTTSGFSGTVSDGRLMFWLATYAAAGDEYFIDDVVLMPETTTGTTTSATADTTAPSTPAGLNATTASSSQINLSWKTSTDNIGVAGYRIYRNGSLIAKTQSTSYANTGLSASTSYTYNVAAYDASNNSSSLSSSASATTTSAITRGRWWKTTLRKK